jgi:hypothetical protein
MMLLGNEGVGAHHWLLNPGGGTQLGVWNSGPGPGQVNPTLPLNTWTHVAITSDGSTLTGYINGTSIGTTTVTFDLEGTPVTFAQVHNGENYFDGTVDDFKIYARALTAGEVATAATPPSPSIAVSDSGGLIANGAAAAGQRAFGNQLINTSSATHTFTVTNNGTLALNVSSLSLTGANAGEFTLGSLTPAGSIAIGGTATFTVTFSPTSTGSKAATVNLAHDGTNTATPFLFDLSGTGTAPAISVQRGATSIANGANDSISGTTVGNATSLTYTVNNTGNAALNLTGTPRVVLSAATNCSASVTAQAATPVAASSNTTFTTSVTPAAVGAWSFTLSIANDDGTANPYTWTVSGSATAPAIAVSDVNGAIASSAGATGVRAFGNQVVGSSSSAVTITITNSGSAPLTIGSLSLTGADASQFSLGILTPASPIAASASATFTVTFSPTSTGAKAATINIAHNGINTATPFTFDLSGTGVTPQIAVADTNGAISSGAAASGVRAFGNQAVGSSSAAITITVSNPGTSPLTVSGLSLTGTGASSYALGALTPASPVAAGGSSTFTVTFTPVSAGAKAATVNIAHNGSNTATPFTFDLSGNGIAPTIAITRGATSIPKASTDPVPGLIAGTPTVLTYTVNNTGTAALNLTGTPRVVLAGTTNCSASVTAQPSTPIAASGNSTFTVSINPTVAGAWSFTLSIASNDALNNPYAWTVNGVASWPVTTPPSPWGDVDIGTVGIAGGTTYSGGTFTIKGSGDDIGGGVNPESFHFMYQPLTGNATVTARVTSMTNTNTLAKAGIMFRSDLTVAGSYFFAAATPSGTLGLRRTVTNLRLRVQPVSSTAVDGAYAPPTWLRVVRNGNTFTSYKSHDGVTWVLIETVNLTLPATMYVGIAVTSKSNGVLNTTVVNNITVGP